MERVKTDDNNMRIKDYLSDTQRFTPPESDKLGEGL